MTEVFIAGSTIFKEDVIPTPWPSLHLDRLIKIVKK
jgi:hypothetical protein